jgi:hypothetical protein
MEQEADKKNKESPLKDFPQEHRCAGRFKTRHDEGHGVTNRK